MAHLYKVTEWESSEGRWYCNDVSEINSGAECSWAAARVLDMKPVDYVKMLVKNFNVRYISYKKDVLIFSFENRTDCKRYVNFINKKAREKGIMFTK